MLPVGWLVVAVVVAVLLTMWVTFTLTRLDRLHARLDAAQATMDAQLVRRAAALLHVAESADSGVPDERRSAYHSIATRALGTPDADSERQDAENAVGRAVAELAAQAAAASGGHGRRAARSSRPRPHRAAFLQRRRARHPRAAGPAHAPDVPPGRPP